MKIFKTILFKTSARRVRALVVAHLVLSVLVPLAPAFAAADLPTDPSLGESILFISNNRMLSVDLETTIFKPEGPGPFPVVVINHGKAPGSNRIQPRARYEPAVREFLQRGYAIVIPMRQGFSNSGGAAVGESGCNIDGNGNAQAEDVRVVVAWIEKQPWADTTRMVMMGQSHGGLTTLSYAQNPNPGFKVFVNFAGGLVQTACMWERSLQDAYENYGGKTKVSSLWFYGENDGYFPPQVIQPAYQAYVKAGGQAEMVAYGPFGVNSHYMFASKSGVRIWWPKVEKRLQAASLPTAVLYPQYARARPLTAGGPPPSGFAEIDHIDRVPNLNEAGRNAYELFLTKNTPRVFALGEHGEFGWASGGQDPLAAALNNCSKRANAQCKLYAVDQDVVWKDEK